MRERRVSIPRRGLPEFRSSWSTAPTMRCVPVSIPRRGLPEFRSRRKRPAKCSLKCLNPPKGSSGIPFFGSPHPHDPGIHRLNPPKGSSGIPLSSGLTSRQEPSASLNPPKGSSGIPLLLRLIGKWTFSSSQSPEGVFRNSVFATIQRFLVQNAPSQSPEGVFRNSVRCRATLPTGICTPRLNPPKGSSGIPFDRLCVNAGIDVIMSQSPEGVFRNSVRADA